MLSSLFAQYHERSNTSLRENSY